MLTNDDVEWQVEHWNYLCYPMTRNPLIDNVLICNAKLDQERTLFLTIMNPRIDHDFVRASLHFPDVVS